MSELLEYSGLATKIKAMKAKLLTEADYYNLMEQGSIAGIVSYLKKTESYRKALAGENESAIRRHRLEELVRATLYSDFDKIYKFSHETQKAYLKAFFMKYEIAVIKKALRRCYGKVHNDYEIGIIRFPEFEKRSNIDLKQILLARNVDEVIASLAGTGYYNVLRMIWQKGDPGLFDYESVLDIYYFKSLWKASHKVLSKGDLDIIRKNYGQEIDLLNIQWAYRAKKYYKLSPAQTYSLVIPIYYKIKKQDILYLAKVESEEEFMQTIDRLPYIRKAGGIDNVNLEKMYDEKMKKLYQDGIRKNPYSIACIESYFYQKEKEIDRLIRVIECVRYSVKRDDMVHYILGA